MMHVFIVLQTLYHTISVNYGLRKRIYDIYKIALIVFCSIHTIVELTMLSYGFHDLEVDELAVSLAYGIQHFLGVAKAIIM